MEKKEGKREAERRKGGKKDGLGIVSLLEAKKRN